jgi:hypothetical protein
MIGVVLCEALVWAHDFEGTQVTLSFAADGAFVLDVANDAAWLQHRLIPFGGGGDPERVALRLSSFADRVVLFVDGREIRPASVEYIAGDPIGIYRMRGRMPLDAQSLRWYYGLPMDPYPLTVRRADGRIIVEEIAGDAWSRPIDLSGQFHASRFSAALAALVIAGLSLAPLGIRLATKLTKMRNTRKDVFVLFVFSWFSCAVRCSSLLC